MAFCPRCGTENPPAQAACSACGNPLPGGAPAAAEPAAPTANATNTMLGTGASPPPAPASGVSPTWPDGVPAQPRPGGAPTAPGGGQLQKTMLGMGAMPELAPGVGAPAAPAVNPGPAQPPGGLQHTMLGIAPAAPAAAAPGNPPAAAAPAAAQHQTMLGIAPAAPATAAPGNPPAAAAPAAAQHRTMLGIAPAAPAAAAPGNPPAAAAPAAAQHQTMLGIAPTGPGQPPAAPASATPGSSALASQHKTMLGIAHPGIAPLDPTANKPAPAAAPPWSPPPAPLPAVVPTADDQSVLPGHKPRRTSLMALLAIGGFVVLLAGVVVIAVLWKSSGPVSAKVTLDAQNHEQLELGCPECPDGTRVTLGKASATFKSHHALLPVSRPLALGNNDLQLALTKPGEARAATVKLTVPVDYRVSGELSQLSASPPALRVVVQATKGSSVSVDGKPLELAADGTAHYDLDVSKELSGAAARLRPLERKVAYSVKPPGAKQPDTGVVKFQLGIVPLVIDAPGPRIITDARTFMLAGHTEKGGTVRVGGRPVTVDAQGSFAQLMNVSAVGQITINVRASAKDRAPRLFPLHVVRVKSLRDEALKFQKKATQSYAGISSSIDSKKGWAVVLPGKVVEARVDHHRSYVLFNVSAGCRTAPCLARLVYGEAAHLSRGERITAYGHVTRGVNGPRRGTTIPEVDVDFFLKEPP